MRDRILPPRPHDTLTRAGDPNGPAARRSVRHPTQEAAVKKLAVAGPLAALAALAVAVTAPGAPAPQKVAVSMTEFTFSLSPKTVKKQVPVTFTVANKGAIGHDFRIAGKKTPVIASGRTRILRVTFAKAGRYPYICTLPTHATAGMKGVLVVK
jgi:plastocyanin